MKCEKCGHDMYKSYPLQLKQGEFVWSCKPCDINVHYVYNTSDFTVYTMANQKLATLQAELASLNDIVETACQLWARETTGLGGKMDRAAWLARFKRQVQEYRKSESKNE